MILDKKIDKETKKIKRKMKVLCEILEVDHMGLIQEALEIFARKYNELIVKCHDIYCSCYNKCDKIHCFQIYEYTEDGIIKKKGD